MTRPLRLIAVSIAIAGVIDPAVTISGAARARLALVVQQPASPAADIVRDRLIRDLSTSYEIVPQVDADAAAAVVIGGRYPDEPMPDALLIATVSTADVTTSGVRIARVDAPHEVPAATVIHLDVEVEALHVAGRTTDVSVAIKSLEVGRASHTWTADEERWRASIDVVPVGEPPYVLRVEAIEATVRLKPDATEAPVRLKPDATGPFSVVSGFSRTVADIVVGVRRAPFRVQFFDPRPSWATTFVRRALERDARFQVASLSFTSRGIAAQSGGEVRLGDPRIDGFDVVIVGGLDRLWAADARSLERYMRERGGASVLVPDQRIDAGPARDLVSGSVQPVVTDGPGPIVSGSVRPFDGAQGRPEALEGRLEPDLTERLLEHPAPLAVAPPAASLQASELLVLRTLSPGTDVIARLPGREPSTASPRAESRGDDSPVIVSMPRGEGRLLLSGAMDAWRFRAADNGAFDRFWQSTIAGLALAVPPPIAISVVPPLLRPGGQADVIVRVRSRGVASVSASLDGDQPIRLRPEPEAGVYRGTFTAKSAAGRSTIEVRVEGSSSPGPEGPGLRTASRTLLAQPDVQHVRSDAAPSLSMLASSHRGIDVTPDHVADLERFLRTAVASPRAILVRHPMRSVWWIVPFAGCLSAEWWMRRRRGLR